MNPIKNTLILLGLVLLAAVPHAFAQEFVALAPIPGLTQGVVANSDSLVAFFNNLYKYLIGFAAMLAIIEIIWGGLLISVQDSVSKQGEGREKIQQAIFGLILVLSPVLVFSIINPSILNLSLKLPEIKLKTTPATTVQTSMTTPAGTQDQNSVPPIDPNATTAGSGDCIDLNTGAAC